MNNSSTFSQESANGANIFQELDVVIFEKYWINIAQFIWSYFQMFVKNFIDFPKFCLQRYEVR